MFRIVFWNVYNKDSKSGIVPLVAGLVADHSPDILALAECEASTGPAVLRALNQRGRPPAYDAVPGTERVRLFLKGQAQNATVLKPAHYAHKRFHVVQLNRGPAFIPILLVPVHMISLLEKDTIDIDQQLRNIAFEVRLAERSKSVGHQNTVVFGDFNAHPFSLGVSQHGGLHAVLSRTVAERGSRMVVFNDSPLLFNPMWQFYGNAHPLPLGTYYREGKGDELAYFWNMFDQFLIRPALLPYYQPNSVQILTASGRASLIRSGVPDAEGASDHLPVMLTLHC